MKNIFMGVVITVLMAGTAANGLIYQNTQSQLELEQQRVAALSENLGVVTDSLYGLQDSLGNLEGSLSTLGSNVASLDASIGSLDSKVGKLEGNSAALNSDIDALKGTVGGINGAIAGLNTSISGIQGNVSTLQGSVSSLKGGLSSLEGSLANGNTASAATVASVVAKVEPSIVRINTNQGSGSGSIVSTNGYVLTNYHVIQGATTVNVVLKSGETISAKIISTNQGRDLAVLKMNSTRTDFPAITMGSSADVKTGEEVVALGFPLGSRLPGPATVTKGIVSAVRTYSGYKYLQMDASINPGNSGGALVNMKGELIGINSAVLLGSDGAAAENLGLAIPVDEAKTLITSAMGV